MNPHLQRAFMLVEQARYELAEQQLGQALAADPQNATAHALFAICLSHREKFQEASAAGEMAIHLAPDDPYPHYAHSIVLRARNHFPEAERAIGAALELDPHRPEFFAQQARIQLDRRRWRKALEAAEQGLELDAEDVTCANLRSMALVKLGRKAQAGETIAAALARDPEDATTHANQGWTLIEQGQPKKAMEHFREALRLDPEMVWARRGIVEALKARYFIYRWMLAYFLWMSRLSGRARWGVIIAGCVGYWTVLSVARNQPHLAPWIMPLIVLYVVFVVMTWVANPLFNLLLRLHPIGRLALSREQIITANWVGLCVLGAVVSLVTHFGFGLDGALLAALACGLVIPPLVSIYQCHKGWPRTTMMLITLSLAVVGLISVALMLSANFFAADLRLLLDLPGVILFLLFLLGAFVSQFVANALPAVTPRR